jgi:hypothetical protein
MPENKLPGSANRPRLLSDILEIPLSESAIPEEYTMHRSSASRASPSSNRYNDGQVGLYPPHFGSFQQPRAFNAPAVVPAPDPGIIGQRTPSSKLTTQGNQRQPLAPLNPQMAHRYNENRRSTPNLLPILTTSPAFSDTGSPSHTPFPALEQSFSQTSLSARRYSSRPRTPTPSDGSKGKGKHAHRSSSLPSSPKSRRATPHPHGKPSVKHLTCFWWKVKGDCRFSEDDCLYAHRDTGLLADAPRQVTPGGERIPSIFCAYTEYSISFLRTSQGRSPPGKSPRKPSFQAQPFFILSQHVYDCQSVHA